MIAALKDLFPRIDAWAPGALADLTSIENYQRRHWPESRATFERRLTAIERRIAEFPQKRARGYTAAWRSCGRVPRSPPSAFLQRRLRRNQCSGDSAHIASVPIWMKDTTDVVLGQASDFSAPADGLALEAA
jgi:hypothetical protein